MTKFYFIVNNLIFGVKTFNSFRLIRILSRFLSFFFNQKIIVKVIRRMIREKRRRHRIDQMKKGESINTAAISDDSDKEGEFQFSTAVNTACY